MNLPCPLDVSGRNASVHAREENRAVAGIRSLPGLGHFMRDREYNYFDATCFPRFPGKWKFMEIRKERGFFFLCERKKREKGIKSFEVSKFFCLDNFLDFFWFFFFDFDLRRQVLYFWANKQRYIVTKFLR